MIIINHDNINHDNTVQLGTSQKVSARMDAAGNEVKPTDYTENRDKTQEFTGI